MRPFLTVIGIRGAGLSQCQSLLYPALPPQPILMVGHIDSHHRVAGQGVFLDVSSVALFCFFWEWADVVSSEGGDHQLSGCTFANTKAFGTEFGLKSGLYKNQAWFEKKFTS